MRPELCQPRQLIFELRELNLQSPLMCPRMHRKDVEDETAPVNHLHFKDLFKAALLCRRKLIIRNEEREPGFSLRSE